jgi:hypothetical protein
MDQQHFLLTGCMLMKQFDQGFSHQLDWKLAKYMVQAQPD